METAEVTCMLQCGECCNPVTDAVGVERWESIRQKTLQWKGLDKFGSRHKKTEKKHTVNESQLRASSTAEVSSQDETTATKRLRLNLGLIHE